MRQAQTLVRREPAAGHGVGNHTWSHRRLTGLRGGRLQAEVGATSAAIAYQARAFGLRLVLWDVDSNDWRRPGAGVIAGRVLSRVRSGDVVLFHDGGGSREQTLAALDQVLSALSARGFRFSALCRG